ncbi:hypothetical protein MKU92_004591 [Salmonella enterica]|nr:hypothetical protein [Salmonella enterica]
MGIVSKIIVGWLVFFTYAYGNLTIGDGNIDYGDDCGLYINFSKKIIDSNLSDEVKLEKIYTFVSDEIIQCEKYRYDIELLKRKTFSYKQNGISIFPLFLSSCNTIVNGDTCNSEQHDWSRGIDFRHNNKFEKILINEDAKIPFVVNGYKFHLIYFHWIGKGGGHRK